MLFKDGGPDVKMTPLEKAIFATLSYADIFDYPLTENELWKYLIGIPTNLHKFRNSLASLLNKKQILIKKKYYVLPKRSALVVKREQRERIALGKARIAKKVARLLAHIPSVNFVGISGALSMQNAPIEDDIDFFVITAPGMLWITRLLTTLLLDFLHLRRRPGETKYRNKICLNMYMDATKLTLPANERDLYSAHEIAQLKPLIDKHETHALFLNSNKWVKRFLPHAFATHRIVFTHEFIWFRILAPVESWCRGVQLIYMARRRTTEKIRNYSLKFHPEDVRERVMGEYEKRLNQLFRM